MLSYKFLIIALLFTLTSCKSDDDSSEMNANLTNEELLIQGSPWTFDRYVLIQIVRDDGLNLTESEIVSMTEMDHVGEQVTYRSNFTGIARLSNGQTNSFNWIITPQGKLELTFQGGPGIEYPFDVTGTELLIEAEAIIPDPIDPLNSSLVHYGRYYYK